MTRVTLNTCPTSEECNCDQSKALSEALFRLREAAQRAVDNYNGWYTDGGHDRYEMDAMESLSKALKATST